MRSDDDDLSLIDEAEIVPEVARQEAVREEGNIPEQTTRSGRRSRRGVRFEEEFHGNVAQTPYSKITSRGGGFHNAGYRVKDYKAKAKETIPKSSFTSRPPSNAKSPRLVSP